MKYKVLSLDGGGSWAMIQADVLKDLYGDINGHELLQKFDMVIANSGGSLVLASLCNNMKLSDIKAVFMTQADRTKVFSKLTFFERLRNFFALFSGWLHIGPKYDTKRKLHGLLQLMRDKEVKIDGETNPNYIPIVDRYLDELPEIIGNKNLQIIIVGFDYFKRRANFFRSNTKSLTNQFNGGKFFRIKLGYAIHASSNAPVNYFIQPATIKMSLKDANDQRTSWFWDGAVSGFNNPVLAGVIECITNGFTRMEDYRILSIGTGTGDRAIIPDYADSTDPNIRNIYEANINNPLAITEPSYYFLKDVKEISKSILMDPPDSATFIAYSILHPELTNTGNLVRINPCLIPEITNSLKYECPAVYKPKPKDFERLLDMDMDAVENNEVKLINDLCENFINENEICLPNQLIRGTEDTKYIGYPTYKEAKKYWQSIE